MHYLQSYFNGNFESTNFKDFNDSFFVILSISGPDKPFTTAGL